MIKPPSQQVESTLIYSGDPALNLPTDRDEREKALEIARDTGTWGPLLSAGASPTLFHVRPIFGSVLDWLQGQLKRRDLHTPEAAVLALRLALRRIENFGGEKVTFERDDGQQLAAMKLIDALYAVEGTITGVDGELRSVGRDIVQELGGLILLRAFEGLRPKS